MENRPLQLKTTSVEGSGDLLVPWFYRSNPSNFEDWDEWAGTILIKFSDTVEYNFNDCDKKNNYRSFDTPVPSGNPKIWTISKTGIIDPTYTIVCNGVQVLQRQITEANCASNKYSYWSKDVSYIYFSSSYIHYDVDYSTTALTSTTYRDLCKYNFEVN